MSARPILPGATLGVLGGGQLGRMFAQAAQRMGYRVLIYAPETDAPAGQVAEQMVAPYEDAGALRAFAQRVAAVTIEFENIPVGALEAVAERAPVRPGPQVLHVAQHRLREKTFLSSGGFPVAPFQVVTSAEDMGAALATLGGRAVLKTAGFGYDGKGQRVVRTLEEARHAYAELGGGPLVMEGFVRFEREVSVIVARSPAGDVAAYPAIQNDHARHILDVSVAPAPLSDTVQRAARDIACGVAEALDLVGLLCAELFLLGDETLLINELAPRPHNSGHLTLEACATSQFEQQLRALCGLPLGDTALQRPAAMANLLGDVWAHGEPDWARALRVSGVALHLYGKAEARPGRKMGHLTALGNTVLQAKELVLAARGALHPDNRARN